MKTFGVAVLGVVMMGMGAVGCTNATTGTDSTTQAGSGQNGNGNGNGTGDGTTNGNANGANGTPGAAATPQQDAAINANTQYVPEPDQTKATEIATRMWTTLTSHKCWYLRGSTNNYSFSGVNDYRYAGTVDTYAGQIGLISAGKYGPYDAADIMINGEEQWLGIYDSQTMAIAKIYNGQWMINWYVADDRLCV